MPLVFVHGVNNRRGSTPEEWQVYDQRLLFMREQFRQAAFGERVAAPDGLAVFMPYWGDLGVSFARNLACLPQRGLQALAIRAPETAPLQQATAATLDADILGHAGFRDAPLVTLARHRSLGAAVDLLFAGAANAPVSELLIPAAELSEVLEQAAQFADGAERYAAENPRPDWLDATEDDDSFVARLVREVTVFPRLAAPLTVAAAPGGIQPLSAGSRMRSWLGHGAAAVRRVVDGVLNEAKSTVTHSARDGFLWFSGFVRPAASAFVGRFFGDAFKYLENRQPIIDCVLTDVDRAVRAKQPGDKELYLVGHSFGGIILYDILTHFRPDLECDLYVTVGSQVALFAEMGRLADAAGIEKAFAAGPDSVVPRPAAAMRWLNIFDLTDFVGFGTRRVFAGAHDFQYDTDALPIVSHGAYFDTPRFFGRLRERVREVFLNGTDTPQAER